MEKTHYQIRQENKVTLCSGEQPNEKGRQRQEGEIQRGREKDDYRVRKEREERQIVVRERERKVELHTSGLSNIKSYEGGWDEESKSG